MMQICAPSPPLAGDVAFLWHAVLPTPAHDGIERVLPDGSMQIVISLHDAPMRVFDRANPSRYVAAPSAIVTGPSTQYSLISAADTAATIGASFTPGGAAAFLGVPPVELFDTDVDLPTLWGRALADELRNRVLTETTPEARVAVLDEVLCRRLQPDAAAHPAVRWAVGQLRHSRHPRAVADVVARVGMSHRRLTSLFHGAVGVTPKRLHRLARFQEVVRGASGGKGHTWADLALACGYADQAHLTHDFRAFAGVTPSEYLRRRTSFANHLVEPTR